MNLYDQGLPDYLLYANPQLTREVMISLSTSILSDLNRKKETENLSIQAIQ
jgi:hypothetical protein